MPACELRPATQYDTDAVYALICELKQAEFDHHAFRVGFNANLRDPNMRYHLALLDGEVVGMIGLHLQFHLHHVNWIGEIQELVESSVISAPAWRASSSAHASNLLPT
ncbi:aminoalkylphosphonate N-acetyltransferase, partial [Escherichia sp. TWPC-MK]